MNGGVIVAVCVVAALALAETLVPRLLCVLAHWRQERARAIRNASAGAKAPVGEVERVETVGQVERIEEADEAAGRSSSQFADGGANAQMLWEEAREMPHNFIPDPDEDRDYLTRVHGAAKLGHLEAMVKLGDYAYRRGAVVEAFYWTLLAELKGATGLGAALREMRVRWMSEGCPEEYENTYVEFTEEQGVFARAVLRLQCGVDPQYARARLKELAERGVEDAMRFLKRK